MNPEAEGGGFQFWAPKEIEKQAKKAIKEVLPKAEIMGEMTTTFGKIAKWSLGNYSTEKFEELLEKLGKV